MRSTILRIIVLTVTLIATPHISADFEAGQSAWDAGNVDEALSQWRAAANAGDRRAMLELGRLYRQGLGVVQDYVEAHKWLNLAASRGEAAALEERGALAAQMTPEQIATAQQAAAAWQPGGAAYVNELSSTGTGQPPPQAIRAAQSLLAALGYQPGPADGIWGQGTRTAYQAFLRDMGLPQTDTLTPQALRAIQAAAEQQGVAQTGEGITADGTTHTPTQPAASTPPPVSPDALHNAAQSGDIQVLKAAIAAGVDVNVRDSRGWTALMHTVNKGYLLLVPPLLEAEADVNVRAPDGATALFMAAAHGHTEIIELLMKAGADVSIRGPQGKTPMDVAIARYGEVNVARTNGEPPAVLALLEGMTLTDWTDPQKRRRQQALRKLGIEMISIPAGTFHMGGGKKVTVPAFKLGKHEVTLAQWEACLADGGCYGFLQDRIERYKDDLEGYGNYPVYNISWDHAQSFIDWLNNKIGGKFRLPTEAEWEYAARAGTTTEYSWGNGIGSNRANCDNDECRDSWYSSAPVGSFPANPWGLHDMHGNVVEWVQDCWNESYNGAPTDGSAWTSGDCSRRVYRGGAWGDYADELGSAYRSSFSSSWWKAGGGGGRYASGGHYASGFRLAQDE